MTAETIFTNARIVLADSIVDGSVVVKDGLITGIDAGSTVCAAGAVDLAGDYLMPGLVELHTDHLESHFHPRPKVRWPAIAAVQAHDAQVVASGITTVLDALRVGTLRTDSAGLAENVATLAAAIREAREAGWLKADHKLHIRCELSSPDTIAGLEGLLDDPALQLLSLMDHTPGQRQFVHLGHFRTYYQGKTGMSDSEMDAFIAERQGDHHRHSPANRARVVEIARSRGLRLASHDDATADHVAEAVENGVAIAEFPTTLEAARAAGGRGLAVLMGAPNIVRGGSHSGNISAAELAREGLLDILSSDYVPFSLMQAVFRLAEEGITSLPRAVAMVSSAPARAVGLDDRGEIATGKRADLVRVEAGLGAGPGGAVRLPVVRAVWREGQRVC